jgi:hypothetical protein
MNLSFICLQYEILINLFFDKNMFLYTWKQTINLYKFAGLI